MTWTRCICLAGVMLLMATVLNAGEFYTKGANDTLTFRTKRMEVDVRDARIVGVKSLSGAVLASSKTPSASITAGLGNMTGQVKELSATHSPWGGRRKSQLSPLSIYRFPSEQTRRDVAEKDGVVTATWSGLSNGKEFFPNDSIVITFREDKNGALEMSAIGKSPERGVFGIQVPIENLDGQGKFVLPTLGGIEYPASGESYIMTFKSNQLFYEAEMMTYTLGDTALGYWFENATFRPSYAFFGRDENASSFALEINTIMPFEAHDEVVTPVFKIDVFDDAGWIAAARPFRDWYQSTFAADIARRNSVTWTQDIHAISDASRVPSADVLDRVTKFMDPQKVLLHVWHARKMPFDVDLPDFTPRDDYREEVQRAHDNGFKVMCYVNPICVNYMSDVWVRDNIKDFFLLRKNSLSNYQENKNAFDANVANSLTVAKDADPFANIEPRKILYGDPLSPGWRKYFTNILVDFHKATGTDAYYQDCLGVGGDLGNGVIDGLSGAQGNVALTRDILQALPDMPMASEYGLASVAFGVNWPLIIPSWGSQEFHKERCHNQRPLSTFILGYRPWISAGHAAANDFRKHLHASIADALGGMAMFVSNKEMDVKSGYDDHFVLRAKTFVDNSLAPYYPERKYPENVLCMYKDAKGGIYNYYDDGKLQMLRGPDGKARYGRVSGVSSVKTADLQLPGWPCYDEGTAYGLNPEHYYALFPSTDHPSELNFGRLPENVQLARYYATEDFAYAEFTGTGQAKINVKTPARFTKMLVNDKPVTGDVVAGELPLRLVFFTGKTVSPDKVRKINLGSGLEQGQAEPLPNIRRTFVGKTLYYINYNVKIVDSVHRVENDDEAIEFLFVNTQEKHGNGSILTAFVNGKSVGSFDCYTPNENDKRRGQGKFDTKLRKWSIPVGHFKGQEILFTVQVDDKESTNADCQYVSLPEKVRGAKQEFVETFPDPEN